MNGVVEIYAWGEDWSPITVVSTGTVITAVYYPHKTTADAILSYKRHSVYCCMCESDVPGTKPRTRRRYAEIAILNHLKQHGRRTKKRNGYIARMAVSA